MEKLIEYYNEYNQKKNLKEYYDYIKDIELPDKFDSLIFLKDFCKWLVDNDKIEPLWKYIGWETDEDEPYIKFDLVDQYIAYLSIQESPIEFLISILK